MAEGKVLSNQQIIIENQKIIIANQAQIQENQKALSKVLANQKKILALLARVGPPNPGLAECCCTSGARSWWPPPLTAVLFHLVFEDGASRSGFQSICGGRFRVLCRTRGIADRRGHAR